MTEFEQRLPRFRGRARIRHVVGWRPSPWFWVVLFGTLAVLFFLAPLVGLLVPQVWIFFALFGLRRRDLRHRRDRLSASHDVTVDDAFVTIGDRRIARASLQGAYVVPRSGSANAALRLARRARSDVDLVFERPEDAGNVMRALSLDTAQRALRVYLPNPIPIGIRIAAIVLVYFGAFRFVSTMAMAFALVLAALLATPRALRIGADGVAWSTLGGARRFVPLSAMKSARRARTGRRGRDEVHVALTNGETLRLDAGTRERAGIVSARIQELVRLRDEGPSARDFAALLERGDRSASQWLDHLRTLAREGGHGYRDAALGRDELVRVASSPASAKHVRIAAAAALVSAGDREDVATIARATADPNVRHALEALARDDADDQAIVETLAELEREASARRS